MNGQFFALGVLVTGIIYFWVEVISSIIKHKKE